MTGSLLARTRFSQAAYGQGALSAGVVVFAIGIYDQSDRDKDPGVLTELARITGGEAFFPAGSGQAVAICQRIAAEVRPHYILGISRSRC